MNTPTKNIEEFNIENTPDNTSYVFGTKQISGSVKGVRWKWEDFKGDKGDKGDQGVKGDNPIKGVDYFDGLDGNDGREIEIQKSVTHIQWRYVGDTTWINIVPLMDLKGNTGDPGTPGIDGIDGSDGKDIELQKSVTHIQWRKVGDTTWIDLVSLEDLRGPAGSGTGDMLASNNLSDVADVTTARTNLGVYSTSQVYTKTETDNGFQVKETSKQEYPRDIICSVASTANIASLSGTMTIDGVALAIGDYILVKNQSTGANNGVYQVNSGAWTRATEYSTTSDFNKKDIYITSGTTNTSTWWLCATLNPTVGTTAVSFAQIPMGIGTGATQASAGNHTHTSIAATGASSFSAGLTSTGNTIIGAGEFHRYTNRTATGSTATTDNIVVFTGSTASQIETIPDGVAVTSSSGRIITYVNLASVDWTIRVFTSNTINGSNSDIILKTGEGIQIFNTAVDTWVITNRFRTSNLGITDITGLQTALDGTVKTTGDQTIGGVKTFTGAVKKTINTKLPSYDHEVGGLEYWNEGTGSYVRYFDIFAHGRQNSYVGGSALRVLTNSRGTDTLTERLRIYENDFVVNGQNRTSSWNTYNIIPTSSGGGIHSDFSGFGRYKVIGKTCYVEFNIAFKKNTLAGRPRIILPIVSRNGLEIICNAILGGIGTKHSNQIGLPVLQGDTIEWLNGIGQAGDWTSYPSQCYANGSLAYEIA